jgi:hypothetical protein
VGIEGKPAHRVGGDAHHFLSGALMAVKQRS